MLNRFFLFQPGFIFPEMGSRYPNLQSQCRRSLLRQQHLENHGSGVDLSPPRTSSSSSKSSPSSNSSSSSKTSSSVLYKDHQPDYTIRVDSPGYEDRADYAPRATSDPRNLQPSLSMVHRVYVTFNIPYTMPGCPLHCVHS